jgi:hypothetical protein
MGDESCDSGRDCGDEDDDHQNRNTMIEPGMGTKPIQDSSRAIPRDNQ